MRTIYESGRGPIHGFVLLEALIALIIFAVGLLAIAAFQGNLIKSSAESRAYTEAMHIAQGKLDELRSLAWGDLEGLTGHSATETRVGSNETFNVAWSVGAETGLPYRLVSVTVESENSTSRVENGANPISIQISSFIARTADVQLVESPGDAQRGIGPPEDLVPDSDTPERSDGFEFGTADGERYVFVPETGEYLKAPPPDENGGGGFARISGNLLFFKANALKVDPDDETIQSPRVRVVATGNSLCQVFPAAPVEIGSDYEALGYTCFVGSNWLGPILVAPDADLQVCSGAPDHRPLAFTPGTGRVAERRYFGVEFNAEEQPIEIGIRGGVVGDAAGAEAAFGSICSDKQSCWTTGSQYLVPGGHHFLIKGSEEVKSCAEAMMAFPAVYVENAEADFNAEFGTEGWKLNPNNLFYDNPAGLVCTTRPTCGAVTNTHTTFRTRLGGFLDASEDLGVSDVHLSGQSLNCQAFGKLGGDGGDGSGIYWCPLRDPLNTALTGVVGDTPASEAVTGNPDQWSYRIERGADRTLVVPNGKSAGEEPENLDRLALYDFAGFNFGLTRREADGGTGNGGAGDDGAGDDGAGDDGAGDDGNNDDGQVGSEACRIVVAGGRKNSNQIIEVSLPLSGGSCTFPSNSRYECVINSNVPVDVELTARGPGNNLDEHRVEVSDCAGGSRSLSHNFP